LLCVLYAADSRGWIATYWIVNLVDHQVEVFTQPTGEEDEPDYAKCEVYAASDSLPVALDGKQVGEIAVAELLP